MTPLSQSAGERMTRFFLCVLGIEMVFAVVACFYLALSQAGLFVAWHPPMTLTNAAFAMTINGLLCLLLSCILLAFLNSARGRIAALFQAVVLSSNLFLFSLLLGLLVRVLVAALTLPAVQISDGASYFELAGRLVAGLPYQRDGYAFWPPGTPLMYACLMWFFGLGSWAPLLMNSVMFVLTGVAVRSVCMRLHCSPNHAGLTMLVLALWPELFLTAAQVSKETLLIALLPCALSLLLSKSWWSALASGFVAGLIVLTQPSLGLLPLLFGATLLVTCSIKMTTLRVALMVIGMLTVLSPWTYRNYLIFGEFVPVSTNSGLVLHAGNQSAMLRPIEQVGGFLTPPAPLEEMKDDLALSRWHTAQAFTFIKTRPTDFAMLTVNRIICTLGDDSDSAYRSLRLTEKVSKKTYIFFKALSNAYWLLLISVLAVFCWQYCMYQNASKNQTTLPVAMLACLATLYLLVVHGIAEGGARHHMGWAWLYALILVMLATRAMPILNPTIKVKPNQLP